MKNIANWHLFSSLKFRWRKIIKKAQEQAKFEILRLDYLKSLIPTAWGLTVFPTYYKPQQHPARDAHDTFFLSSPASALNDPPADYLERVRNIHQNGGFDSKGYGYEWSKDESMKNVLRTHTTAVSAKMLYKLAQQKQFTPTKYFRFLLWYTFIFLCR